MLRCGLGAANRIMKQPIYLAAYDIAAGSRRTRCARLLLDHGFRCQQSVYELPIARPDVPELLHKGERLIDAETDRLLLLPVSRGAAISGLGRGADACRHDLIVVS